MENKKYLLDQIRKCKRKMNLAKLADSGVLCAAAGGIAGMFCELVSLFWQFYYANLAAVLCFAAGFLVGICHAVYRRVDMKQAASRLDSFGLKERMLTACENMDSEDELARMQRQDALLHYDRIREQIKIPLLPDKRHILALAVSAAVVTGLGFIPSPVREQAKLHHEVQEQAREEKEALEEFLDALEEVDMESLTQEQREKLEELLDAMELSREEIAGADSWENLSSVTQRLDYKYEQAAQSLEKLAGQMENPQAAGIASAEAFAKALAKADQDGEQMASGGTPSGSSGQGDGEGKKGNESGEENGEGGESGSGEGNNQGGEKKPGEGGQGEGNGQGGGNGSGNGEGSREGSGEGNGKGSGNGSGDENGQGNGNGSGNGTGSGRGTGSSSAAHDYVSVPGGMGDDSSLTGNRNGNQDSDYYRQKNGLAWEGDHVDYNSVIGEYTDSAYEGIANGKYPSGMEEVIRNYFENLNK